MMKFDNVIEIIEKAMQLGYAIESGSEEDGMPEYITIRNNGDFINFYIDNNNFQIVINSFRHSGKLRFNISKSELLTFRLYVEKIEEYREKELLRDIKDLFPKPSSINELDEFDDEDY